MKKIIILIMTILMFSKPVFADDITFTDEEVTDEFKSENYIPKIVNDSLKESNIDQDGNETLNSVLGFALSIIKDSVSDFSKNIGVMLVIGILISIFRKVIDNPLLLKITSYIFTLSLLTELFNIIKILMKNIYNTANTVSEILSAVLPSFTSILLLGGNTFTSFTEAASFGIVLTLISQLINKLLLPFSGFLLLLLIFERISPHFSELNLLKLFKKNVLTLLSFITMIMMTVISYQHIISAGKDSVSSRTVKFAASNFIPIIGSAVGESLKTLSTGVKYLKTTVGGAVILAITVTVLPVIIKIFIAKLYFNLLGVSFGILDCKEEQGLIESSTSVIDIFNSIIISTAILSLLLIILFIISTFSVTV